MPNLVGLAWSASDLRDSGMAFGVDADRRLGVPGTLDAGIAPGPAHSLRALTALITGEARAYRADAEAGLSADEQTALVAGLLSVSGPTEAVPLP